MRIIGGKYKGFPLSSFEGKSIRPTADRTREMIFNWLGQSVDELKVLDAFAGTGAFGLEALSRNAGYVLFCDINHSALSLIKKNLSKLKVDPMKYHVRKVDFWAHVSHLDDDFDLIFIDPPYADYSSGTIRRIDVLLKHKLNDRGICVMEMSGSTQNDIFSVPDNFKILEKKAGNSKLLILEKG